MESTVSPKAGHRWSRSGSGLDYGAIILCVTALIVHLILVLPYACGYFFLFDDFGLVHTAALTDRVAIFTQPLFGFFRPLLFLLTRAEFTYFGWHNPAGYALVAVVLHIVNATLIGVLARQLGLQMSSAVLASTLFILSPWSTEAYLWQSAQFDLLATLGSLVYFVLGLRIAGEPRFPDLTAAAKASASLAGVRGAPTPRERRWKVWATAPSRSVTTARSGSLTSVQLTGSNWHAVFALVFLALALAAKELAVVSPVILMALVVSRRMSWSDRRAQVPLWVGSGVLCVIYLIVRQRLLPGLSGAYGSFFQLMSSANLMDNFLTYCRALVIWVTPESESFTSYAWFVVAVLPVVGVVVPGLLINATRANLKLALRFVVCLALSLTPVLWVGIGWTTSSSGRFLYLPAMWFVLLLALGFDAFQSRLRRARTLVRLSVPGVVIVVLLGAALASVAHQITIWSAACDLARQALAQVRQVAAEGKVTRIHVRNLPYMFVEGPYVLKTYAFRLYEGGLGHVKVRADVASIRWRDGRMCALGTGADRDSDYVADPNDTEEYSLTLKLPIEPSCDESN